MEEEKRKFIVMYEAYVDRDEHEPELESFVEKEPEQIAEHFNSCGVHGSGWLSAPYVFLSNKIPRGKRYGNFSEQDIISELNDFLAKSETWTGNFSEQIISTAKKICTILEKSSYDLWEEVSKELREFEHDIKVEGTAEDKRNLEQLIQCISKRKILGTCLFGEYLRDRHQIIVYYNNVRKYAAMSKKLDFNGMMSIVLAHEYFHAMHCALNPNHPLWTKKRGLDESKKIEIKEALADAYSVVWCFDAQDHSPWLLDVAEDRFNSWKRNYYSSWPYAKAILLFNQEDIFSQVLDKRAVEDAVYKLHDLMNQLWLESDIVPDKVIETLKW